jgi:hypothetical protein
VGHDPCNRFIAELCLEVDRLSLDNPADVATLVQAMEVLWRAELDRQIGRGGVLSGLFDGNSIACGLITGGAAVASGMPAALSAASALGGGLVNSLVRLLGNLTGGRGAKSLKRAKAAHFRALEGWGRSARLQCSANDACWCRHRPGWRFRADPTFTE